MLSYGLGTLDLAFRCWTALIFFQPEVKQEPTLDDSSRTDQRCSFYFFLSAVGGYPWTHSNPAQCEAVSALGCFTAAYSLGAFTMLNPHGLCYYADVVKDFCLTWFFLIFRGYRLFLRYPVSNVLSWKPLLNRNVVFPKYNALPKSLCGKPEC